MQSASVLLRYQPPPFDGVHTRDIEKVKHLLESGIYHTSRDIFDGTPLIRAAQHGHREVIHLLVEHGASVTQEDMYH